MTKIVLTTDQTLLSHFHDIPLGNFLSCMPAESVPDAFFNFLTPYLPAKQDGSSKFAPYGLRKVEASLLRNFKREDVVVAHPKFLNKFIGPDTEIVGIYSMDPLGLGPVSMMYSCNKTAYTKKRFTELVQQLPKGPQYKYKVVCGGPGVWQLDFNRPKMDELGIDYIVMGESDVQAPAILQEIIQGTATNRVIKNTRAPRIEDIPAIVGASSEGMVECMRGCGRGCQFCEVTLRPNRYMPFELLEKEINVNIQAGMSRLMIHTDDLFMYKFEDRSSLSPNCDAIVELFQFLTKIRGLSYIYPSHGSISPIVAEPELIPKLSQILGAGPEKWIGIQQGLETGSPKIVKKYMPLKVKPLNPDDWQEIVLESLTILNKNYWSPAYTLITGLPDETTDDVLQTIDLVNKMDALPIGNFTLAPLSFVPIGVLRGQGYYNREEMIDEARFNLIYACWKHNVKCMNKYLLLGMRNTGAVFKPLIYMATKLGQKIFMNQFEAYGRKRGFEVWKPETNLKVAVSV